MPGIIVGVDGSSQSQRALQWALSEAAARHAPLTVLSVRHDRAITYATGDLSQDQAAEEVLALSDQAVSRRSGPAPPVTVQMMPGWSAAELFDAPDTGRPAGRGLAWQRRPGPAGVRAR